MEHSQPLDILFIYVNVISVVKSFLVLLMRSGENVVSSVTPLELASSSCCNFDSLVNIISGLKG